MTHRRVWLLLNYGPGGIAILAGVGLILWGEVSPWFGIIYVLFALTLWASAGKNVSTYRVGYWRGRMEMLDDMARHLRDGTPLRAPRASDPQPNPWDEGA